MQTRTKKYLVFLFSSLVIVSILIGVIAQTVISRMAKVLLVKTKVGSIRGFLDPDGGEYYNFLGVPYATVNKSMPFSKSIPHPPFKYVFKAYDEAEMCPQLDGLTARGNLDCLHLNIYVPRKASLENRLPVLVYIHGGRYEFGFAGRYLYGMKYLLQKEIILVTFNYRLGPYGFMCLDIPEVPGNQGLEDQRIALRWVKRNIENFGGDSDRIIISGASSGGESVYFHLMYGKEKLFHRAIIISGIKSHFYTLPEPNRLIPIKIAEDLGFRTNDVGDALNFLTLQDSHKVIASSKKLQFLYNACVEKSFVSESFITDHRRSYNCSNINEIPIFFILANNEQLYRYSNMSMEIDYFQHVFENAISDMFNLEEDRFQKMVTRVRQFYIGDDEISENVEQRIIDFITDLYIIHPSQNFLRQCVETGATKIYHAVFSYFGKRNYLRMLQKVDSSYIGATRSDENGHLFDISYMNSSLTPEDQLTVNRMTELATNFVKYGVPIPTTSELLPVKCQPITNDSLNYLEIDKELSCRKNLFQKRMSFWDLFYKFNGQYEREKNLRNNKFL